MAEKFTIEQNLAINKRNSNVLVSASAGSGKTKVLITRVINRVIIDEIDIDRLLVVTFTNAAALELKERLKKSLDEALKNNKDKSVYIKKQIKLLNRANISTLHAFCLKVIRENFEKLEIDPNFKVAEESEIYNLKLKALNSVFEDEYKKNDKSLIKLLQLFNYKEEDLFLELLNIYSYIMCYGEPFKFLSVSIEKYNISDETDLYNLDFGYNIYEDVISKLTLLKAKLEEKILFLNKYEDFGKIVCALHEDFENIDCIIRNSEKSWDKLYNNLKGISFKNFPRYQGNNLELKEEISNFRKSIVKEEIKKCQKSVSDNSKNIIKNNKIAYEYLKYIMYILEQFQSAFFKLKLEKNIIDFSDIEHMMYKLLYNNGDVTEFSRVFKNKFLEVYTDEYQDISEIQEEILKAISNDNSRFMVGDTKQSIYRFRGASPDIFNEKIEKYNFLQDINSNLDTKILLTKNFRSRKEVVNFVNLIFETLMSKDAGGCNYGENESLKYGASYKNENDRYIAELNVINLKKDEVSYKEDDNVNEDYDEDIISELKDFEIESYYVAEKVKNIVENLDVEVNDKIRKAKYSDIVILLRNVTGKAKILEEVFKKKNIPIFCDISSSIFDSEEVDLLLSFLRLLDNRYQDIYLVASMYSVLGNFNLDEIVKIKNNKKATYFYDLLVEYKEFGYDKELVKKIDKFLEMLNYYEELAKKKTVSELILDIYNNTGLYYSFVLEKEGKTRCANLDLILNMCLEFEKNNLANLSEYIYYVDSLKNKIDNSSMSAKIIGENEDVVRVMTIHKSKGLEFPIVILCDSGRKYNFKDLNNKVLLDKNIGIGINIVNEAYNISYPSIIKQAIKYNIINELKDEELRVLYVALTRAKEKLIVFGTTKDYEKLNASIFTLKNNTKLDPYVVHQNDSYLKNILSVLKTQNYSDKLEFNLIKEDVKSVFQKNEETFSNLTNEINCIRAKCDADTISKKIKDIDKKINSFNLNDRNQTIARISVSQLKENNSEIIFELPECLSKKTFITGARKGTLTHFILQILDFKSINNKTELECFINNSNVISQEEKKSINMNSINNFLNSSIGISLKNAKIIKKEQEFILKNSIYSKCVIQGIIDLYYIDENDNLILVDFKTDNLKTENEFIEKYEKQLLIYKEALEKLLNKKVYKTCIYSFKLNKEIIL